MSDILKRTHIVVHHSLTRDSGTVSWQAIRKYHMETNGWDNIGYHGGIELVNDRYEIILGRPLTERGAHCKEMKMNSIAWGICCVGNFDLEPPPDEMLNKLRQLVWDLMEISGEIPVTHVIGHREAGLMAGFDWREKGPGGVPRYKSCPGILFDMTAFRASL